MDLHHGGDYQSEITLVDPTQSPTEGDEAHLTHQILHDSNGNTTTTTTTTTPTESHLINHHHHHLIALQEEEVVYGHPQGSRGGRLYKKSNWVVEEMLVLQAAKREDLHRKGSSSASQQAQERWNWIEDFCWASGVQRSAQQCHDKWEVISTAYKKVYNNEKYVCSGQKSYWNMSPEERKRNKLPPNFQKEIFTALLEWCNNKIRNSDSGELVVDTSGPLGPSGVKAELLDSEEESGEETSGPNQSGGKKRKLWCKGEEGGLASILVRNNKNVVEAMLESEDRKDKRHREDLEMERVKLELEKEKFRGAMRLGSGYIEALVNIGDGLKQLSAALCSNIHS